MFVKAGAAEGRGVSGERQRNKVGYLGTSSDYLGTGIDYLGTGIDSLGTGSR